MRMLALALCAILGSATAGSAQSPLARELEAFATRYHEDSPRLDRLYQALSEASLEAKS